MEEPNSLAGDADLEINAKKIPYVVLWLFLIGMTFNVILIANPGFYSHDELDWRNRIERNDHPWSFGMGSFTSSPFFRLLGAIFVSASMRIPLQPFGAHVVEVLLSIATAGMLYVVVSLFRPDLAFAAAVLFMVMPGFAYSTGWIAAEYDIQYTFLGVCTTLFSVLYWRGGRPYWLALSIATFAIALGCKETAFSIPICIALVAFIDRDRFEWRRGLATAVSAGAIMALYLGVSATRILRMSQSGAGGYSFGGGVQALSNAAAYFGFPFTFGMEEIGSSPLWDYRKAFSRIGPHFVLIAIIFWRGGPKWVVVYLVGFFATLLPVLPISKHETQYTYASSIALALALAATWSRRIVVAAPLLALIAILVVHGLSIQVRIYQTGACQTRALETLAAVLPHLGPSQPLAVFIPNDAPWPVISRAVFDNSFPLRGEYVKVSVTRKLEEAGMIFHGDCRVSVAGSP